VHALPRAAAALQFGIKPTGKKFRKTKERKWNESEAYKNRLKLLARSALR
jgi:hypothetical protein